MLSEEQISSVAARLNERINIPMIGEEQEQSILEQAVNMMNEQLGPVAESLPEEAKEILGRIQDGISEEDAATLKESLVPALNERVDIPMLSEDKEADMLIAPAVDMIISTLQGIV